MSSVAAETSAANPRVVVLRTPMPAIFDSNSDVKLSASSAREGAGSSSKVAVLRTPIPPMDLYEGGGSASKVTVLRTLTPSVLDSGLRPVPAASGSGVAVMRSSFPSPSLEGARTTGHSIVGEKRPRENGSSTAGSAARPRPPPVRLSRAEAMRLIDHAILQVGRGWVDGGRGGGGCNNYTCVCMQFGLVELGEGMRVIWLEAANPA
jgi:hypothetical protein